MMVSSELCNQIFDKALSDYRTRTGDRKVPAAQKSLEDMLYRKNWIDNTQWDAEDLIRDPSAPIQVIVELKRQIDGLNQDRTDLIEKLDDLIFEQLSDVELQCNARINTETPAWAIDRLSILHIKIYQMFQESQRMTATEDHRAKCQRRHDVLVIQKWDLSTAIDQLLVEMRAGTCQAKTYKQMKMYNDPELNPVLRSVKV